MLPRGFILFRVAVIRGSRGCLLKEFFPRSIGPLRNYSCVKQNAFYCSGFCCQQFEFTAKRGVRTFPKDLHERKHKSRSKKQEEHEKSEKSGKDSTDFFYAFERKKPTPEDVKKVRGVLLFFAVTATALTLLLFTSPEFKQISSPTEAITMEDLLNVYLPSGEVKKLIYVPSRNQLVALLYPGAIIQGGQIGKRFIVVQCGPNGTYGSVTQEIREKEKAMGIAPMAGIQIDNQEMWGAASYVALLLCMLLIGYLSARLTTNVLKRFFEVKGMKGTKKQK